MIRRGWLGLCLSLLVLACCATPATATGTPEVPTRLRLLVESSATAEFGLDAPVALFAAQIHQESRWEPEAASAYAQGLTQFTPATAAWIAALYPAELAPADPWDPAWAIRAQMRYMRDLARQFSGGATRCDDWAFALAGYNGGPGWVRRDQRLAAAAGAAPEVWFGEVELHTKRGAAARKENRGYVRRILLVLEARYIAAGWPGTATCGAP